MIQSTLVPCMQTESFYGLYRIWLLNWVRSMERGREFTISSPEGGIKSGAVTGLVACGVDWNGDNKCTQSHIF